MEFDRALEIACRLQDALSPYCERIQIAGSVRRLKADCGDIELVAKPKMLPLYDMFGEKSGERSLLNDRAIFERHGQVLKGGKRYVQVALFDGINLDLFVVMEPAQWGVIMAIRTGPADFSKWLVTPRSKGGALPNGWKVEDGRVWDGQVTPSFPEENDFLAWVGVGDVKPAERQPRWNYFRRDYRG